MDELRILDIEVAEKLMGWTDTREDGEPTGWGVARGEQWISWVASPFQEIPHYSTNIAAARYIEDEIESRNLWEEYVIELCLELELDGNRRNPGMSLHRMFWMYLRATPRQRCKAALRTLDGFLSSVVKSQSEGGM